jgi:hypothetical protein
MKKSTLLLALPVLIILGCGTLTVRSDYDRAVDFTKFDTFAFFIDLEGEDPTQASSLVSGRIKRSIEKDLLDKGLEMVEPTKADLLVAYHVMLQDKVSVDTYGYRYNPWGYTDVNHYTEGMLVIDLVDAKTRESAWRGVANDVVKDPTGSSATQERIDLIVNKIMRQYPPKK